MTSNLPGRLTSLFVFGALAVASSGKLMAQDTSEPAAEAPIVEAPVVEAPATETAKPVELRMITPPSHMHVRDRWENALDVKLTDLFDRKAADVASPTIMLNAEWNYKFITDTFLGAVAGGLPQPIKQTKEDGEKISYSTYYFGARLAQGLLDIRPFRLVLGVNAARGFLYTRVKAEGVDAEAKVLKYNLVEPSLFFTFWIYQGVEFGLIGSHRIVAILDKAEHEDIAKDKDLTSTSYGLTFRTQRF